jgi:hypothetical protein
MAKGSARIIGAAVAAVGLVLAVRGAALGQGSSLSAFEGVWSGPTQMLDDEAWNFEDFACFLGCPTATFAYARALFSDPGNYDRSYAELQAAVIRRRAQDIVAKFTPAALASRQGFDPADDPAIRCRPYGLVRQALSPVPIEFIRTGDSVTIKYELWEAVRTVFLDGSGSPAAEPTRLGHSSGRLENGAFIVETTGILAGVIAPDARALHSGELRTIERYTLADEGNRLDLELTLIDPMTLTEPLILRTSWRRTPETKLLSYQCRLIDQRP